jgi:hypothetical protein
MNKYYGNDNFNLQNAYDDCKQVFESITDAESYQKADSGVVMYYANEIIYALEKAIEEPLVTTLAADDSEANDEAYEMYAKGYLQGYKRGKKEIPAGKWIFDAKHTEFGNPYGTYKCNQCGGHSSDIHPFCFWCGADMRKGDRSDN